MTDYQTARFNMVESQIHPSNVCDQRLLKAILEVPRELFVPQAHRSVAYMDGPVRLESEGGTARYLLEPRVFAKLVALCDIHPDDVVLDVGCASGYSTVVLARLAGAVVGLECDPGLAQKADAVLTELGVDNGAVVTGPLEAGYPSEGPYDVILLNGSVPDVPPVLLDQLKEGGRLVAVQTEGSQTGGSAKIYVRSNGAIGCRTDFDAAADPLPGFELAKTFTF